MLYVSACTFAANECVSHIIVYILYRKTAVSGRLWCKSHSLAVQLHIELHDYDNRIYCLCVYVHVDDEYTCKIMEMDAYFRFPYKQKQSAHGMNSKVSVVEEIMENIFARELCGA